MTAPRPLIAVKQLNGTLDCRCAEVSITSNGATLQSIRGAFSADGDPTHTLKAVWHVPVWRFPQSRFVEYENADAASQHDEAWARPLKFGGVVSEERSVTIPRAYIKRMDERSVDFVAIEEPRQMGDEDLYRAGVFQ